MSGGGLIWRRRWRESSATAGSSSTASSSVPSGAGGVERARCGWWVCLAPCWVLKEQALLVASAPITLYDANCPGFRVCVSDAGVGWLFVEMCIVDASIFVSLCR